MKLLGIDAGFRTGYSVVEPGVAPFTGSREIPGDSGDGLGHACHAFGHLIQDMIREHKPDGIVVCVPYMSGFTKKTKTGLMRTTGNVHTQRLLFGLFGMLRAVAHANNVKVYEVSESRVRAAFGVSTPKIKHKEQRRKALKGSVLDTCAANSWMVKDDHAADALLAAVFKLGELRPREAHKATPLFRAA